MQQAQRAVVAISRETLGQGSKELGRILIKRFVFALSQQEVPPRALLLLNGGVRLALMGSNVLDDLRVLAGRGCEVLVCDTSLAYFEAKDRLAVGKIADMKEMAAWLTAGAPVVNV